MSPSTSSVCYTVAACKTERDLSAMVGGNGKDVSSTAGRFQFGIIRKQEIHGSNSPLKVSKDSHRIRKPPLPLPQVQYRPPIIIHTYSPKIIHTQPDDFMSLVQKLTGSSDTRLRLKKSPSSKKDKSTSTRKEIGGEQSADATILERQGSGGSSSATTNCGSPSSSEDSATFLVTDQSCGGGEATIKQSNSPRSPLDSNFEFDNSDSFSMFSQFADPSPGTLFNPQVKAEPMFSFNENASFNFFADFMHPVQASKASPKPVPRHQMPQQHQNLMSPYGNIDIHSSLPSSGLLSPNLMAGLSPGWSQSNFLDCLNGPAPGSHFDNQAPYLRQRQFSGGYTPSPEDTMVALENIHAFILT